MTEQRPFEADAIKVVDESRVTTTEYEEEDIDHSYFQKSKWARFYRSVLLQMFLFGA